MNPWSTLLPVLILVSATGGIALMAINLRKARIIEDTPTAKIRSAAQGYLSISGIARAIDSDVVIAPLTGQPCLWYHYTIERLDRGDKHSRWTTIERGSSEKFFAIDDTTGLCHIDPRRAEVTATVSQCWQGDERRPLAIPRTRQSSVTAPQWLDILPRYLRPFSQRDRLFSRRYRYTEERIHAQEWVYALGWFETVHGPSLAQRTETQTKALLNAWKLDRDTLLARFDLNGDGEISLQEWERARRTARWQAEQSVRNEPAAPAINTMSSSPLRDQPYVLGTSDPRNMAGKYRREAIISLVAGFGIAAFLFWRFYKY